MERERRVRRRADFLRAQNGPNARVTTRHFTLVVAVREDLDGPSRLGLVVSRKVGVAVVRNRVKRVCRACFRGWPGLVPAGVDLVVIARDGAGELGLSQVRAEWTRVASVLGKRAADLAKASRAAKEQARP